MVLNLFFFNIIFSGSYGVKIFDIFFDDVIFSGFYVKIFDFFLMM